MRTLGVRQPPNMGGVPADMLQSASPAGLDLYATTGTVQDEKAAQFCRSFEGIEGLRRLQSQAGTRSFYDAGCGWRYKAGTGGTPELCVGALGTSAGPAYPADAVSGGAVWYWDLQQAERDILTQVCGNVQRCQDLKYLGKYADVCGFCKTSGSMIPVINGAARYRNDPMLACARSEIVTVSQGQCPPAAEGFRVREPFAAPRLGHSGYPATESFADFASLDNCKPPLTRDCLVLAAQLGGCSDKGALLTALQANTAGDYDAGLKDSRAWQYYTSNANPRITPQLMKDGSASIDVALADFTGLADLMNKQSQTRVGLAARDLCLKAGDFDVYSFCADMNEQTIINQNNLVCVQTNWKSRGGTEKGSQYPTLATWRGSTYGAYVAARDKLIGDLASTDKTTNAKAIAAFLGLDTDAPEVTTALPRNENTRGAETIWFNTSDPTSPIVLRADLRLAKEGESWPLIQSATDCTSKYGVPGTNIAFTLAFEIRPDSPTTAKFRVISDDGFMLGLNQNPFDTTEFKSNDWGMWRIQGPTLAESGEYRIAGEKEKRSNLIVVKWFQGGGSAFFAMNTVLGGEYLSSPATNFAHRKDFYLTQEPLAPWLQYEVVTRGGVAAFAEKRFNGPCALSPASKQPIPSFDTVTATITIQTEPSRIREVPGKKPYLSLLPGSSWHTRAAFAFDAFKTITLLVRPMATLTAATSACVFQQANFKTGVSTGFYLKNTGSGYLFSHHDGNGGWTDAPCTVNQWNFVVIQYVGERGIRRVTFDAMALTEAMQQAGARRLLASLATKQSSTGPVLFMPATQAPEYSGLLLLGGTHSDFKNASGQVVWKDQSFTGDVAWVHGFRNFLDTEELLIAELKQSWISRW